MDLRDGLEAAYQEFHQKKLCESDAIFHVHKYSNKRDQEIVAFFSALLAYGNIRTILQSISKILDALGPSPFETIVEGNLKDRFRGFTHRFTKGEDIEILGTWLHQALKEKGTLETFYLDSQETSFPEQLSSFVVRFREQKLPKHLQSVVGRRKRNLKYLLSDPKDGSACKRLNLFLRWVARPDDGIDLGLWQELKPASLRLPVDTHILKVLQGLKWTQSKTANWKVVESATKRLREFDPNDPIRYDFSLCHLSMHGGNIEEFLRSRSGKTQT